MRNIMRIKRTLRATVAVVTLAFAAGFAQAEITITAVQQPVPIGPEVAAANTLTGVLSGSGSLVQTSGAGNARSPWTTKLSASAEDRGFLYVQTGTITFDLAAPVAGSPAAKASFLWGSPDTYNKVELFDSGSATPAVPVATIVPGAAGAVVPVDSIRTYLVTISGIVFDKLVFSSTRASFEFANLAVLPLDINFACGDEEVEGGSSLRRLDDVGVVEGTEDACAPPIPARLDFDGTTLTFLADYSGLEGKEPAFAFDVAWFTEWVQDLEVAAIPYVVGQNPPAVPTALLGSPLSVQWFGLSPEAEEPYELDYCPGQPEFDDNSQLVALTFPAGFDSDENGVNDMSAALPGFQYGCLVSRVVELVEDDVAGQCGTPPSEAGTWTCVRVKESGYLRGDWTATRTLR